MSEFINDEAECSDNEKGKGCLRLYLLRLLKESSTLEGLYYYLKVLHVMVSLLSPYFFYFF